MPVINTSCRRRPASNTLKILDPGMRRDDDKGNNRPAWMPSARAFPYRSWLVPFALVFFLNGCMVGPDFVKPV
jgi:hypothetical protein